jgi:putative chitinase
MGNGNRLTGDGWRFRGRGYIMITGKTNYKAFGDFIGVNLLDNPDLIATKYPLTSAAWFFDKRKLWSICDQGVDIETIKRISILINGGVNGMRDRVSKTNVFTSILA